MSPDVEKGKSSLSASGSDGRVTGSHHGSPDQLEREGDSWRASDGLGLGALTGVDAVRGRRLGDRKGLGDGGGSLVVLGGTSSLVLVGGISDLVVFGAIGGGRDGSHGLGIGGTSSSGLVVVVLLGGSSRVQIVLNNEDAGGEHG